MLNNTLFKEDKSKSGIYRIINVITNKSYIGSSVNFYKRMKKHSQDLIKNKHHSSYLQNSYNKYGKENFVFEIIAFCPKEYIIKLEQWFLDNLKPEYNIRTNAKSNLGLKMSASTKEKLRKINIGKKMTDEQKLKISLSKKGRKIPKDVVDKIYKARIGLKRSKEAIEKTRLANLGSKRTEKQKQNISNSLKGKILSVEHKEKISAFFKGSNLTKEHKEKISNSHKKNKQSLEKKRFLMRGSGSPSSKLKEEDVLFIKQSLKDKSFTEKELSKKYNVSESTIANIKKGKCWSHVV